MFNILNLFKSKDKQMTDIKDSIVSNARINILHPSIRKEVKDLIIKAESVIDQNVAIRVVQGLRTIEEQNELFSRGRTKPGKVVTNARGGRSYHNYGTAIDICLLLKDKDGVYKYDDVKSWQLDKNFREVVKIFKEAKYTWGGDFKTIVDNPHFENNSSDCLETATFFTLDKSKLFFANNPKITLVL